VWQEEDGRYGDQVQEDHSGEHMRDGNGSPHEREYKEWSVAYYHQGFHPPGRIVPEHGVSDAHYEYRDEIRNKVGSRCLREYVYHDHDRDQIGGHVRYCSAI